MPITAAQPPTPPSGWDTAPENEETSIFKYVTKSPRAISMKHCRAVSFW